MGESNMRVIHQLAVIIVGLTSGLALYAGDIYQVPEQDLPLDQAQYDVTVNIEVNVYGNTLGTTEVEETMTDDVHPYTVRNMQANMVRTRIIEDDFVSVHVLQTSPSEIGTFTEDLFTGDASQDIDNSLSSIESADNN